MARTPDEIRAAYAQGRPERSDDQELLDVGHRCAYEPCDLVDFLTFECQYCSERHCNEHKAPEGHKCKKWNPMIADRRAVECPACSSLVSIPPGQDPNIRFNQHLDYECGRGQVPQSMTPKCQNLKPRCDKVLWVPFKCESCQLRFCATHRDPKLHNCTATPSTVLQQTGQSTSFAQLSSQASARSAAAMAAIKRATQAPRREPLSSGSSTSAPGESKSNFMESATAKLKLPKVQQDRRAIIEQKSRLEALRRRKEKGILSAADEETLRELEEQAKHDKDCIIA